MSCHDPTTSLIPMHHFPGVNQGCYLRHAQEYKSKETKLVIEDQRTVRSTYISDLVGIGLKANKFVGTDDRHVSRYETDSCSAKFGVR